MSDHPPVGNHPWQYLKWRWRHRRCPGTPDGRHRWIDNGEPAWDRTCQACGISE